MEKYTNLDDLLHNKRFTTAKFHRVLSSFAYSRGYTELPYATCYRMRFYSSYHPGTDKIRTVHEWAKHHGWMIADYDAYLSE